MLESEYVQIMQIYGGGPAVIVLLPLPIKVPVQCNNMRYDDLSCPIAGLVKVQRQ